MQQKVVLITGASSGIGQLCAQHLNQLGYRVYGTSRRAQPMTPEALAQFDGVRMLPMDVTVADSVERGVATVLACEGRIDVLVNNAGFGIAGAVEDTPIDAAQAQFETNLFGNMRVTQSVLPNMRRQSGGLIVNISSIAGRIGIPFQAMYSASKFAIEGYSEALRLELAPWGIHVALIEPGDFRTGFTAQRQCTEREETQGVYQEACARALGVMERDEQNGPTPEAVAHTLARIVRQESPRLRYPVGRIDQKAALVLKNIIPCRWFERVLAMTYHLSLERRPGRRRPETR